MADNSAETVNTILGSIQASELGETLTREHIFADYSNFYTVPLHAQLISSVPYHLNYYRNLEPIWSTKPFANNILFNKIKMLNVLTNELNSFRAYGGKTIVENSSVGVFRDINLMKTISNATNINIIVGTGLHLAGIQNKCSTSDMKTEHMYNHMYQEMVNGCYDCPDVKAGFIEEIGVTSLTEEFEKHSVSAVGMLQEQLRCPVNFHCKESVHVAYRILRLYQEAGGDTSKAVMSHADCTFNPHENLWNFIDDEENLLEFMGENKCYVRFDNFGARDCFFFHTLIPLDIVADGRRIQRMGLLKKEKLLHRVLISHNIQSRNRLMTFGGHGYVHIAKHIVPNMLANGFLKEDIDLLRIENPKRWLTRL